MQYPLKINNISVTDPTVIANSFNDLVSSNFTISDDPDIVDTWCEGHQGAPYLTGIQTNSYEVLKIIKSLKKWEGIWARWYYIQMLKHTAAHVVFPLALIFNISSIEGKIPDDWKRANVVPIHKSGDIGSIKNYRPISLCPVIGKLLEKVVTIGMLSSICERVDLSLLNNMILCQTDPVPPF